MNSITLEKNDIYKGALILVNADYPLTYTLNRRFLPVDSNYANILLEQKTASSLAQLLYEIDDSNHITLVSGYRSKTEQENIYSDSLRDNGIEFTKKYVAFPNHSEHQTGFAVDLGLRKEGSDIDFICPDFPYYGVCDVFRQNAPRYGFIERYPKSKEEITGISHEPWHFRYVGYPHSEIIQSKNITLEEYMDYLKQFRFKDNPLIIRGDNKEIYIYFISFTDSVKIEVEEDTVCEISGNNIDGCIITEWRNRHE